MFQYWVVRKNLEKKSLCQIQQNAFNITKNTKILSKPQRADDKVSQITKKTDSEFGALGLLGVKLVLDLIARLPKKLKISYK